MSLFAFHGRQGLRSCAIKALKRFTPRFLSPVHVRLKAQRERKKKEGRGASWRRRQRPHVREEGGSERRTMHCLIHPFFFPSSYSVPSAESSAASLPPSMLIPLSSALQGSSLFFPRTSAAFQRPRRSPERSTFGLDGGRSLTADCKPGHIQGHRAGKKQRRFRLPAECVRPQRVGSRRRGAAAELSFVLFFVVPSGKIQVSFTFLFYDLWTEQGVQP